MLVSVGDCLSVALRFLVGVGDRSGVSKTGLLTVFSPVTPQLCYCSLLFVVFTSPLVT